MMMTNEAQPSSPSSTLLAMLRTDLMRYAPFAQMATQHVDAFIRQSREMYFAPDETIITPTGGAVMDLYYIRQGLVTGVSGLADLDNGAFQFEAGDLFPVSASLAQRAVTASYRATADTFLLALPVSAMRELAAQSAPFADFLNRRVVQFLDLSKRALAISYSSQSLTERSLETPLGELVQRAPITCGPDESLKDSLQQMADKRVGSMLVVNPQMQLLGILTQRDVLTRIALPQVPLTTSMAQVMRTPVFSLSASDTAQQAALLMSRHGIRHVPVTRDGAVVGMVSERDLFALQRQSIKSISSMLHAAGSVDELTGLAPSIRRFAGALLAQGVQAKQTTALISHLNDLLTQRLISLLAHEHGVNEQSFCWLALGSEGRMEQTIATDQDNALITADGLSQAEQERLITFAKAVNQALDACGFPLCKGGVMAHLPAWCMSQAQWLEKTAQWIDYGSPQDLLAANIFFDLRGLAGNVNLALPVQALIQEKAPQSARFLKLMASEALDRRTPFNWLGGLDTQEVDGKPTIDLKLQGTAIFVGAARIYALANGPAKALGANATRDRLEQIGPLIGAQPSEYSAWVTGFEFLQTLRLRIQLDGTYVRDANRIDVSVLNDVDRKILKVSLGEARSLQQRLGLDYGQGR